MVALEHLPGSDSLLPGIEPEPHHAVEPAGLVGDEGIAMEGEAVDPAEIEGVGRREPQASPGADFDPVHARAVGHEEEPPVLGASDPVGKGVGTGR